MGLDDAIARERQIKEQREKAELAAERKKAEQEAQGPAWMYSVELAALIADFLFRGVPPDIEVNIGVRPSPLRARFRKKQPGGMDGWTVFFKEETSDGPSYHMILTADGVLRVHHAGGGWLPIGAGWTGDVSQAGHQHLYRAEKHLSLDDGSLTAALTEVLARKVVAKDGA